MRKEFKVKSSDGARDYLMEFLLEDGRLFVFCGCPAGEKKQWCKHKEAIIRGDISGLSTKMNDNDMDELRAWIRCSEFPRVFARIEQASEELNNAKKELSNAAKKGVSV